MSKTIAQLADESFRAAEYYRMLGMQNTAQLDYEGRQKSAIAYAEAAAKAAEAKRALDRAIETGEFHRTESSESQPLARE